MGVNLGVFNTAIYNVCKIVRRFFKSFEQCSYQKYLRCMYVQICHFHNKI